MKNVFLENLELSNYRNFSNASFSFSKNINIIVGPNGSGKTNILESISFLSPGKGLKSANFEDLCKIGGDFWKTKFNLQSKLGVSEIESSFVLSEKSRKMHYNASKLASSEASSLLNVIWLTPQMEGLFIGGASPRRKFLDRIVYNFDPTHIKRLNKYDHYVRERNKSLGESIKSGRSIINDSWISTLEEKITQEAKNIHRARALAVDSMQKVINNLKTDFPKATLSISDLFENNDKDEDFDDNYIEALKRYREKDAYSGRTNFGVHKSDLLIFHTNSKRPANICSTGEQKALLISLILASIESILEATDATPIILLDELFVHLDDIRTNYLAEYIMLSKLQTFITTTDIMHIEKLSKEANIINL